jgi:hypothetical protein
MAKKLSGGEAMVSWFDPALEDSCEYHCCQKRGARYVHGPCESKAVTIMQLKRYQSDEKGGNLVASFGMCLCKKHLVSVINECVSMLQALG